MTHQFCLTDPIPQIPDLSQMVLNLRFAFPGLPTLPIPIFPTLSIPSLEKLMIGAQMQIVQMTMTVMAMVKPMIDILSMDINAWLPAIPGIPDINIIDILEGKADKLVQKVKDLIAKGFVLPGLPQLYPSFDSLEIKVIHTIQAIMNNWMSIIVMKIVDLVQSVTSFLEISFPGFPSIPTFDSIIDMIVEKVEMQIQSMMQSIEKSIANGIQTVESKVQSAEAKILSAQQEIIQKIHAAEARIQDKLTLALYKINLAKIDFQQLLESLIPAIPGFPPFPKIPTMPDFVIPDVTITMLYMNFMTFLTTVVMQKIMDFINSTLKNFLSFSFPLLCISIP